MRIANLAGRAVLLTGTGAVDIERASGGRFGPEPLSVYRDWDAFEAWGRDVPDAAEPYDRKDLLAPVPDPPQVFGIGLNYRDHAAEAGLALPEQLLVFTKFRSSLAAPDAVVALPSDQVDWETELVVVIGREAHGIDEAQGWDVVAGLAVGQDLSERAVQNRGPAPQFSLGKSYSGFAPFGPAVVTLEEIGDRDALGIRASIEGPTAQGRAEGPWSVQDGTTADLVFPVARIIADLAQVVTLLPGDLIFTGTPAGVGMARKVFLSPGDVLTSEIDGVGTIRNAFV